MFQYITVDRETSLQTGGLTLGAVGGTLYFKDVQFSYPSRPNQVESLCMFRPHTPLLKYFTERHWLDK